MSWSLPQAIACHLKWPPFILMVPLPYTVHVTSHSFRLSAAAVSFQCHFILFIYLIFHSPRSTVALPAPAECPFSPHTLNITKFLLEEVLCSSVSFCCISWLFYYSAEKFPSCLLFPDSVYFFLLFRTQQLHVKYEKLLLLFNNIHFQTLGWNKLLLYFAHQTLLVAIGLWSVVVYLVDRSSIILLTSYPSKSLWVDLRN